MQIRLAMPLPEQKRSLPISLESPTLMRKASIHTYYNANILTFKSTPIYWYDQLVRMHDMTGWLRLSL